MWQIPSCLCALFGTGCLVPLACFYTCVQTLLSSIWGFDLFTTSCSHRLKMFDSFYTHAELVCALCHLTLIFSSHVKLSATTWNWSRSLFLSAESWGLFCWEAVGFLAWRVIAFCSQRSTPERPGKLSLKLFIYIIKNCDDFSVMLLQNLDLFISCVRITEQTCELGNTKGNLFARDLAPLVRYRYELFINHDFA